MRASYKRWRYFWFDVETLFWYLFTARGRRFRREYGMHLWPRKIRVRLRRP